MWKCNAVPGPAGPVEFAVRLCHMAGRSHCISTHFHVLHYLCPCEYLIGGDEAQALCFPYISVRLYHPGNRDPGRIHVKGNGRFRKRVLYDMISQGIMNVRYIPR